MSKKKKKIHEGTESVRISKETLAVLRKKAKEESRTIRAQIERQLGSTQ